MSVEKAIATLQKEHAKAQASADALAGAIKALGSMAGEAPVRKRRKKGGWPAGKLRGPRKPKVDAEARGEVETTAVTPPSPIKEARAKRAKAGASLAAAAAE